jgi:hypothetical protein
MKQTNRYLAMSTLTLMLLCSSSCSSRRETEVRSEQVIEQSDPSRSAMNSNFDSGSRIENHTTTETTKEVEPQRDVGLFSILGDVIALPFRAVGALLSAIF